MDALIDKRQRILAAASRLIVRNGLQCSMAAIAEEANVATGSLYNYFANKEELVLGVYNQVSLAMAEQLTAPPEPGVCADQEIVRYIARYIDFIWEDPQRARLFDYLDNNPLISLDDARGVFGPFVQHGIAMIEAGQKEGSVRCGAPSLIISFQRGAIRNTLKRHRSTEPAFPRWRVV